MKEYDLCAGYQMKVHNIGLYHPKSRSNEKHDAFSARILNFKDGCPDALNYFYEYCKTHPYLKNNSSAVLVCVPGHVPRKTYGPLQKLADKLSQDFCTYLPNALKRTRKIDKLSSGGNRSLSVHLQSLEVDCAGIRGKMVVILDDVTTTGKSLKACEKKLETCRPNSIRAIVFGKTADQEVS